MTRAQRRAHLLVWLVLGPILVAALVVALRLRASALESRPAEAAR